MKDQEQRLTMRILDVWRSLCRGSTPPRRSQIDPLLFGADWSNCLLIDLDPKLERSRISYVGNNLRDLSWPPLDRQTLSECEDGTLLHAALTFAGRVLGTGLPISSGGIVPHEGEPIVYRSILLPLAEANGRIDGLLGAASFRVVSATEEIHPFQLRQLDLPQLVAE
jgi:hypothetical protein